MTQDRIFHFTLGPVQAFVAQARRTRDFWAGSFLLSTLSAVAMREVRAQGGEVLFPRPDESFLRALSGERVDRAPQQGVVPNARTVGERNDGEPVDRAPQQGVVPNRFKASVPEQFDPRAVCRAVRLAWVGIAGLAWERLPEATRNSHEGLRRVWSRQIGVDLETGRPTEPDPFWQMTWVLGTEADGEDLLDRRKHLRTAMPPAEAGAKCMLMEGWQELSGVERPSAEALADFWAPLRAEINKRNKADLAEGEQLCALALVKRLFPNEFQKLRAVPMPAGWAFSGWKLATGVPSVAYLAAAPWLARAVAVVGENAAAELIAATEALDAGSEQRTQLRMVEEAVQARGGMRELAHLDGSLFFTSSLEAEYRRELIADGTAEETARRVIDRARSALRAICALGAPAPRDNGAALGEPRPQFSALAMDGDNLGQNMAHPERQSEITEALARFAEAVPAIIARHSGFLVYAGGDDVRALLPVPGALPCAREIRSLYLECFTGTSVSSTLSGAVLFAHHKLPLGHVLHEVHDLLDEVAKDGRGRDAIAVQVSSRGGDLIRWAQPWGIALKDGPSLVLEQLAAEPATGEAPFSHRFFHRIEALLRLVNPDLRRDSQPLDKATAVALFTAELLDSNRYRNRPTTAEEPAGAASGGQEAEGASATESADGEPTARAADAEVPPGGEATGAAQQDGDSASARLERAKAHVSALLEQCRPVVRATTHEGAVELVPQNRIEADGAFLVRFLERHRHGNAEP